MWVLLSFLISLPTNAIILFIQTDSRMWNMHEHGIYCMNQSQSNITSHIQSYCDGGIASSHVTFACSFSITPHQTVSLLGNVSLKKQVIYTLFNYIFCNICFLYKFFFSHPVFWEVTASPAPIRNPSEQPSNLLTIPLQPPRISRYRDLLVGLFWLVYASNHIKTTQNTLVTTHNTLATT